MAIFKRGKVYWYHFYFNGQHVQKSTKQGNPRVARQMEAAYRTTLAKGEVGIVERRPAPTLKNFAQRFIDAIQVRCAPKPRTIAFYVEKLGRLLEFEPLASASLDHIDEARIEQYVQQRAKKVAPATVNREQATLRRLLRLAHEWKVINRVPRIRMLPGERMREFVLSHAAEHLYLEPAPQPLRDVAILILDTGLRVGEAVNLRWRDVHLEPVNGAKFGYLRVVEGKSKYARRNLSFTSRVRAMLAARRRGSQSSWVFPGASPDKPILVTSLDHRNAEVRKLLKMSDEFVIHSLRHTMLTRLGEAGADAFTIMRIAGHSSVTVSQRYVHPTPEALERAFERLEALNVRAVAGLLETPKRLRPATVSATLPEEVVVSY
jgi:site-specific recombinase XerD